MRERCSLVEPDIMDISSFLGDYQWKLSLVAFIAIMVIPMLLKPLLLLISGIKEIQLLNKADAEKKMQRDYYAANQKRARFWGLPIQIGIFALILPWCITLDPQPWWKYVLDIFVILMFYDFFYYLGHRYLFHDGPLGGPLIWVHAVHHQQHNPGRMCSSYIHPLEILIGMGIYALSIFVLSRFMGDFHIATIVFTWITFSEINLHNHDLQEIDRFPYKYLKYMSKMHHIHHQEFTSGNFATISLLYDWLFGTYDTGQGYKKPQRAVPSPQE